MREAGGIILAFIATSLVNYAVFMQKRELNHLPRIGKGPLRETVHAFLNCRPWVEAQILQTAGTWASNFAIGLAPLSVVQPINASGVALLAILAVTKLKEKASALDWVGTGSILVGVLLLGITLVKTPQASESYHSVVLWFFVFLISAVCVSTLGAALFRKGERTSSFLGIGVGLMVGLTDIFTKMAWVDIYNRWYEYRIAGFIFSSHFWMAIFLAVAAMAFNQIALQRGKAIIVVALVTGFSNLIPTVVGILAFGEPLPSGALMIFLRLLSVLLIIGGAVFLSLKGEK